MKHEQLIAYLATLTTLVIVFIAALVAAGHHINVTEAFGLGTITGGLIGVLRIPAQRTVTVDNPPSAPVPVEPQPDEAAQTKANEIEARAGGGTPESAADMAARLKEANP